MSHQVFICFPDSTQGQGKGVCGQDSIRILRILKNSPSQNSQKGGDREGEMQQCVKNIDKIWMTNWGIKGQDDWVDSDTEDQETERPEWEGKYWVDSDKILNW